MFHTWTLHLLSIYPKWGAFTPCLEGTGKVAVGRLFLGSMGRCQVRSLPFGILCRGGP